MVIANDVLDGFSIDGLRITRRGLDLPDGLAYAEWASIGTKLYQVEQAIQWLIGDWWNYGEPRYGEMASQALPEGMAYSTFARYAQVSAAIPLSRRRETLSFSHHSEVVAPGISEDDQERLLTAASDRNLSREEFRGVVRRYRQEIGTAQATPRPDSLCEEDNEALVTLIGIHAKQNAEMVDVTYNEGHMWIGTGLVPWRVDRNQNLFRQGFTDAVHDFREMPQEWTNRWDVIVFDMPHLTDAGAGIAGGAQYGEQYGTTGEDMHGSNVAAWFDPFFREAYRCTTESGIVLAKISNMVHSNAYQDQAYLLKQAAIEHGFFVCDEMIKASYQRGGLIDPSWRHVWHVRGAHSYWIVLRKGDACHRPD